MSQYLRTELWTDLQCAGGIRLAILGGGYWRAPRVTRSVRGEHTCTLEGDARWPDLAELRLGRVLRIQTEDPAQFEEWRIRDVEVENTGDLQRVAVLADAPQADLLRIPWSDTDAAGVPVTTLLMADTTADLVINGELLPAATAAGFDWIDAGTIDPTGTFDLEVPDANAQAILTALQDPSRAPGEVDLRRVSTTGYVLDLVDQIGASAPPLYVRTARNLQRTQRSLRGAEAATEVRPRGKQDGAHPGIAFAYWEVTAVSGVDVTIRDPRGAGYPSPLPFPNMAAGWYLRPLTPVRDYYPVTASVDAGSGTATLTLTLTPSLTAGDLIELVLGEAGIISYVGAASAASASVTRPSGTLIGDLVVVSAYRSSSTTIPSVPAAFAEVTSVADHTNALLVASQRATSNGSVTITSTNATQTSCLVFRNARGIGARASQTGTGTSLSYPALTLQQPGASCVLATAGHRTASNVEQVPTGFTFRTGVGSGPEVASFDTDGAVGDYAGQSITVNASSGWCTASVEVMPTMTLRRLRTLEDPAAVATYGRFSRIVDRPLRSAAVNYAPNPFVNDFTGAIDSNYTNASGGTISSDTASATVTGSGTFFTLQIDPGDQIVRTSDGALIGTVLSIENSTSLTLTANALVTDASINWTVRKAAPAGALGSNALWETRFLRSTQVNSVLDSVASAAWRLERVLTSGAQPVAGPLISLEAAAGRPATVWCWVQNINIGSTGSIQLRLINALTGSSIAGTSTVTLNSTHVGQTIRVEWVGFDLSAATSGVRVRLDLNAQGGTPCTAAFGPWGAIPSTNTILDTATPGACDLWHEGVAALANPWPSEWRVSALDLEQIDGTAFPFDQVVLGQLVHITDTQLGLTTTQRLLGYSRDYDPENPGLELELGRIQPTLSELLKRPTVPIGSIARQIAEQLASVLPAAAPADQDTLGTVVVGLRNAFKTTL